MHNRLHERSAAQSAAWLRAGLKAAGDGLGDKEAQAQRKLFCAQNSAGSTTRWNRTSNGSTTPTKRG